MKIQAFLLFVLIQVQAFAQNDKAHHARMIVNMGSLDDYEQALELKDQIRVIRFSAYPRFIEALETGAIDFTLFPYLISFNLRTSMLDSTIEVKLFQNLAKCKLYYLYINSNHKHDYSLFSHIPELRLSGRTIHDNATLIGLKNLREIELYHEYNGQVDSSDMLFRLSQVESLAIEGYSASTFPLEQISQLIGLKYLRIEVNDTIDKIPIEWKNLTYLRSIYLKGPFKLDSLPPFFYQNQNLKQIWMENHQLPNIPIELFEKPCLSFSMRLTSSSDEVNRASQLHKFLNRKLKHPFNLNNKSKFQRKLDQFLIEPLKNDITNMPQDYYFDFEYWTEKCESH